MPSARIGALGIGRVDRQAAALGGFSGKNMSQLYAPLAVVTVKSGWPVIETLIVLLAGKPTMARRALAAGRKRGRRYDHARSLGRRMLLGRGVARATR